MVLCIFDFLPRTRSAMGLDCGIWVLGESRSAACQVLHCEFLAGFFFCSSQALLWLESEFSGRGIGCRLAIEP